MKRDEIWYCENSKGHKIPPYGENKVVHKDKSRLSDINWTRVFLFLCIIILIAMTFSSCSYKLTERQVKIDYELEKAYLEYSYQRDSLIIEFYRTETSNK